MTDKCPTPCCPFHEAARRDARNRYRRKHGLEEDPEPSTTAKALRTSWARVDSGPLPPGDPVG